MHINTWRKSVKQIKPAVPADRARGDRHKLNHMKFYPTSRKNFPEKVVKHWNRLLRKIVKSLHHWRYSKPNWTSFCAICSSQPCLSSGAAPDHLKKPLPASVIVSGWVLEITSLDPESESTTRWQKRIQTVTRKYNRNKSIMKRLHIELRTILTTVLLSVLHTIQKVTYQVPKISSSYLEQGNTKLEQGRQISTL